MYRGGFAALRNETKIMHLSFPLWLHCNGSCEGEGVVVYFFLNNIQHYMLLRRLPAGLCVHINLEEMHTLGGKCRIFHCVAPGRERESVNLWQIRRDSYYAFLCTRCVQREKVGHILYARNTSPGDVTM